MGEGKQTCETVPKSDYDLCDAENSNLRGHGSPPPWRWQSPINKSHPQSTFPLTSPTQSSIIRDNQRNNQWAP